MLFEAASFLTGTQCTGGGVAGSLRKDVSVY
jgi:hypothetical protein